MKKRKDMKEKVRIKINPMWIIATERKKEIIFAVVTATLLITVFFLINFYHVLSYQPFRNLTAELNNSEVILNFGEMRVENVSIDDIQEIHAYFSEKLPDSIKSGLKSNISIRGSFDNLGSSLNAFIEDTTFSGQVHNIGIISINQYEEFIHFLTKSLKNSSLPSDEDFEGIIFTEKLVNFSLFTSHESIQSVKINRSKNNQEIIVFENNLLMVNLSKYNITANTDVFPELRSLPQILMSYEGFFHTVKNLFGYFSISILMDFETDLYLDISFNPNLYNSFTDVLVEFQDKMENLGWSSFTPIKDTSIHTFRTLTERISTFFLLLLIISLFPVFLAGIFILSFVENTRSTVFRDRHVLKLLFRGYSVSFLVFYYFLETLLVMSFAVVLGMISSFFLFIVITWQNKELIGKLNVFELITKSLFSLFNPIPLVLLLTMLIVVNQRIWLSLFRSYKTILQKNGGKEKNFSPKFRLLKIEYLTIIILTISLIISLFIIQAPIDEYNLILGILLILWGTRLWTVDGLRIIGRILELLAEKIEIMILMVSIHKMRLSQKQFCSILFWILLMSFVVPSSIKTIMVNSERDTNYQIGADVKVILDSPLNRTRIEDQLSKILEIDSFNIVNQTEITLGTEYTLHPYLFEIIGVNSLDFFSHGRFENSFLKYIDLKDVATELSRKGAVLIPTSDLARLNSQIGENLTINGYFDYTKSTKKEYMLDVIGTVEYWPTRAVSSLQDRKIQIFTECSTFKMLTDGWNISISHIGFIDLNINHLSLESYHSIRNLSTNVIFNPNLNIQNVSIANPYNTLSSQIFNIFEVIILDSILLIVVPTSLVFFWLITDKMRFMIGILKTLGLPNKQIRFALFGYVFILSSFILIGTGVITIVLLWFLGLFLKTPSGLLYIPQISFFTWLYTFVIITISLILATGSVTKPITESPAYLIMTKE